jgi:hypothetical protein
VSKSHVSKTQMLKLFTYQLKATMLRVLPILCVLVGSMSATVRFDTFNSTDCSGFVVDTSETPSGHYNVAPVGPYHNVSHSYKFTCTADGNSLLSQSWAENNIDCSGDPATQGIEAVRLCRKPTNPTKSQQVLCLEE